jgi:hypothetical protein
MAEEAEREKQKIFESMSFSEFFDKFLSVFKKKKMAKTFIKCKSYSDMVT